MRFNIGAPHEGNEKPLAQHVKGNVLTEWRVGRDRNSIVQERRPIEGALPGPSAGTFFLGGMETTRDELADYLEEAKERNAVPKPSRLPDIQRKIDDARQKHAEAIKAAVQWKTEGYKLPTHTPRQRKALLVPRAVAIEGPDGKLHIVGVRHGR
jgi:hypothetical protein